MACSDLHFLVQGRGENAASQTFLVIGVVESKQNIHPSHISLWTDCSADSVHA